MKRKTTQPTIVTVKPDLYWKLKSRLADYRAAPAEFQAQLQAVQEQLKKDIATIMKDAGLDPAVVYDLDDRTLCATPREGTPG